MNPLNLFLFIKSSLNEINPKHNISKLNSNIRGDILSGITVAIIALPLALAFGEISQLGPIAGVWGAIAGGIVGGFFGGCMVGVSGPTAPKAAQIATFMTFFTIGTTNKPDLVAAFSIIFFSGLILLLISMLKISRFIHYTPYPVIAGFMCGIGVIVILTQINAFVGIQAEKSLHGVFNNINHTIKNINIHALYVAIPSLLVLFLWDPIKRYYISLNNIPAPLIALIIGTSIAYFMNLEIPYIGDKMVSDENIKLFSFYFPNFNRISEFIVPSFALAILAILDSLLSCKVADNMTGTHHSSDRETFGQGMANITAGLFGGVTTATATMRTVANIKFGGKTPLASIVHGITLLSILLGLGFLVALIPNACLAAILFKVGIDILDYRILPILKKLPIIDLFIFTIVLFVTIYADLMIAVILGVIIAFSGYIKEVISILSLRHHHKIIPFSKSNFIQKKQNEKEFPELPICILQPQGPLFFGSTVPLINSYSNSFKHEMLIIDLSHTKMIDLSGTFALEDLIKEAQIKNIIVLVYNKNSSLNTTLNNLNFIKNIGKNYYKESRQSINNFISNHYNFKQSKLLSNNI